MVALAIVPAFSQGANWVDDAAPPKELLNGLVGIGSFNPTIPFLPEHLLHVHSTVIGVAETPQYYPGYIRLQTQVQDVTTEAKRNEFGSTGIEFFSGSTLNAGVQWSVGTILGVTSGRGISNPLPSTDAPVFKETDPQSPIDLRGGLAFSVVHPHKTPYPLHLIKLK